MIEKTLKDLGFVEDPMDPYTGKTIWIKDEFVYYPGDNVIAYYGGEFSTIKRKVKNDKFVKIFLEALK